jgi:transcriptional accessory protein Tex/SPT6
LAGHNSENVSCQSDSLNIAAFGAFGAFIDIGVHQDGSAHISAMAKTSVEDPR